MEVVINVASMFDKIEPRPGRIIVNTTSKSETSWERDLSPFHLGPCPMWGMHVSHNVENAWQFSKVYAEYADKNGNPTEAYWDWAEAGWQDRKAHRYPMGKGAKPLYSLWDGGKLGYIEARKRIYAPLYEEAVRRTVGFEMLTRLLCESSTKEIVLRDYDGYDYRKLGMSLTDVLNNPNKKMGHAFVLAAILSNDKSMDLWVKISK